MKFDSLNVQCIPCSEDVDHTHINMLAELYMEAKAYSQASQLIERSVALSQEGTGLPIELQVRRCWCNDEIIGQLLLCKASAERAGLTPRQAISYSK